MEIIQTVGAVLGIVAFGILIFNMR